MLNSRMKHRKIRFLADKIVFNMAEDITGQDGLESEVGKTLLNERLKHVLRNSPNTFRAKTLKSLTSQFPLVMKVNSFCSHFVSLLIENFISLN